MNSSGQKAKLLQHTYQQLTTIAIDKKMFYSVLINK
jgi:hypothetical protein